MPHEVDLDKHRSELDNTLTNLSMSSSQEHQINAVHHMCKRGGKLSCDLFVEVSPVKTLCTFTPGFQNVQAAIVLSSRRLAK